MALSGTPSYIFTAQFTSVWVAKSKIPETATPHTDVHAIGVFPCNLIKSFPGVVNNLLGGVQTRYIIFLMEYNLISDIQHRNSQHTFFICRFRHTVQNLLYARLTVDGVLPTDMEFF